MKILILLLCVSFFEAYGQVKKSPNARVYHDEQQIPGQSKEDRKTYMPGSLEGRQKSSSINGTSCIDGKGMEFTPSSTGYKKCVDEANRIRQ